jgi:hypothetical protein
MGARPSRRDGSEVSARPTGAMSGEFLCHMRIGRESRVRMRLAGQACDPRHIARERSLLNPAI